MFDFLEYFDGFQKFSYRLALSEKPFVGHPYQPKLWSTFSLRPNVGHPQRPNVKLRRKDDRNYVDDVEDTQVKGVKCLKLE